VREPDSQSDVYRGHVGS